MQSNGWNTAIVLFALVFPWPILAGLCWWFWKSRHDD
jgi:heme/copper-type cytochrome/quinol oxidase subunit 4